MHVLHVRTYTYFFRMYPDVRFWRPGASAKASAGASRSTSGAPIFTPNVTLIKLANSGCPVRHLKVVFIFSSGAWWARPKIWGDQQAVSGLLINNWQLAFWLILHPTWLACLLWGFKNLVNNRNRNRNDRNSSFGYAASWLVIQRCQTTAIIDITYSNRLNCTNFYHIHKCLSTQLIIITFKAQQKNMCI